MTQQKTHQHYACLPLPSTPGTANNDSDKTAGAASERVRPSDPNTTHHMTHHMTQTSNNTSRDQCRKHAAQQAQHPQDTIRQETTRSDMIHHTPRDMKHMARHDRHDQTQHNNDTARQDKTRRRPNTHPGLERPDEVVAATLVPGLRAEVHEQAPPLTPPQEHLEGGLAQPVAPLAHSFHLQRRRISKNTTQNQDQDQDQDQKEKQKTQKKNDPVTFVGRRAVQRGRQLSLTSRVPAKRKRASKSDSTDIKKSPARTSTKSTAVVIRQQATNRGEHYNRPTRGVGSFPCSPRHVTVPPSQQLRKPVAAASQCHPTHARRTRLKRTTKKCPK